MQFYDTVVLDGVRRTRDGYVVGTAKTARTGIQLYSGRELDPDNELGIRDRAVVRVYRPEEEVFHADALASMAHRPVTIDHPAEMITSRNWKEHSGGITGGEVVRDGEFVRVPLTLMDQSAIDAWEAGRRELSWGYTSELKVGDGTTPKGEAYDAAMTSIRCNHLAVCRQARGGSELRLGDHQQLGDRDMPENLRAVVVDGISYQLTDQGAQLVDRLQNQVSVANKALADAQADHVKVLADRDTAHGAAIAAKDNELGKKDAEIADLKGKVVDGAALDALVAARATIVARAKSLVPSFDAAGKTDADIRRGVVAAKLGDAAVKDKSDEYVSGLFDHLAPAEGATTTNDGGASQLSPVIGHTSQLQDAEGLRAKADAAYAASKARLRDGYLRPAAAQS